ncbi:MAG: class I SAM-dependent RNA methyltransferase [Bdellovibrionales bacterium]
MPRLLGITSRGLIEPLAEELQELGAKNVVVRPEAAHFDIEWSELRRVVCESRIASRVLLPVADFQAYNEEDLYYGVLRRHDFTKYIEPDQKIRVEAHVRDHKTLRDQRFVALKTKDAVADQFRKKFDRRPDVGTEEDADLKIVVRVVGPQVSVSLDLTGFSLSNRGYRRQAGVAPLRETVAAGLLRLSSWNAEKPLLDPFCGAGTIAIEAALMAAKRSPQVRSRRFPFEGWKVMDGARTKSSPRREDGRSAMASIEPPSQPQIFAFDVDANMINVAKANARAAGVESWIDFRVMDVRSIAEAPSGDAGWIVTNPPYGERLEDLERIKVLMGDFSHTLKKHFKGWDAWVLCGHTEMSKALRLKAERRAPVWNGPIECRFLKYPLR